MANALVAALGQDLTALAMQLSQVTVQVSGRGSHGSGVIWQPDGLIVTNAHVVQQQPLTVELWDGRRLPAQVLAWDPERDLAALQVSALQLPVVPVGNAHALQVGELVLAVGNPLGLRQALTVGVVQAVAREGAAAGWVQADLWLAPGNSGGLLANVQGAVVGINTMIANGLALAIPSQQVLRFLRNCGVEAA